MSLTWPTLQAGRQSDVLTQVNNNKFRSETSRTPPGTGTGIYWDMPNARRRHANDTQRARPDTLTPSKARDLVARIRELPAGSGGSEPPPQAPSRPTRALPPKGLCLPSPGSRRYVSSDSLASRPRRTRIATTPLACMPGTCPAAARAPRPRPTRAACTSARFLRFSSMAKSPTAHYRARNHLCCASRAPLRRP